MVNCPAAIGGWHLIECFSCKIEIAKAQRSGNQIELTVRIFGKQPCNSTTPRDRFFEILLLCRFGQYIERWQRVGMLCHHFSRCLRYLVEFSLLQHCGSVAQQTSLMPGLVQLRGIANE